MYFVLSWDAQTQQLRTEKRYNDQADKLGRDSVSQDKCLIDPTNQFMALQLYDGIVTIIPIIGKGKRKSESDIGTLGDPTSTRISDLFIRSSAFVHPRKESERPKLAFLYEDNRQKTCLSIRSLDYTAGGSGDIGQADLEKVLIERDDLEPGASHLLPVPAPTCMFPEHSV